MKNIKIIFIFTFATILVQSCAPRNESVTDSNQSTTPPQQHQSFHIEWTDSSDCGCSGSYTNSEDFSIVVIDDCEYLIGHHGDGRFLSHKGNCTFCAERALEIK